MRRRAVLEGLEEEAELRLRLLVGHAEECEHPLLHITPMDTDRAPTDLVAVAHHVVGPGQCLVGCGLEGIEPIGVGRCERMVHGGPPLAAVIFFRALEHGRVDDPEEGPRGLVDEAQTLADLYPGRPEQGTRIRDRPGRKKGAVTRRGTHRGLQTCPLGIRQILGDRATELAICTEGDIGEAPSPTLLCPLLPRVKLPTRLIRSARHDHSPDVGGLEDAERRLAEVLREVDEFETEAQVGLVGAEAAHRLGIGHPWHLADVNSKNVLP